MAARLNPKHDELTRLKIKTSQLVNRLTDHALGKVDMPNSAVRAALGLLAKTLPDLATVQHQGHDGGPLVVRWLTHGEPGPST